ncbi:MAG: DUF3592 domain-containing protein [Candidatus Omnitrophica bacterium]|nr:DUF3592 domain-containing protein [Candidatus Omnitrophota bacterium]
MKRKVLALIFVLGGITGAAIGGKLTVQDEFFRWRSAKAKVVFSDVKQLPVPEPSPYGSFEFKGKVIFEYQADKKGTKSKFFHRISPFFTNQDKAERFTRQFPKNATVRIFYDVKNPEQANLTKKDFPFLSFLLVLAGVAFVFAGMSFWKSTRVR